MLPIEVSLDRLVMLIKNVTLEEYDKFVTLLESHKVFYPETIIKHSMSSSISAYRYNMNFGFGEGGIRIDYRHNTLMPDIKSCDLRIEFNPNKLHYGDYEYVGHNGVVKKAQPSKVFFSIFNDHFNRLGAKDRLTQRAVGHQRIIREIDIAFDYAIKPEKIIVMNLTGKEHSVYKGTNYWGSKHTHGYLKKYDKKAERKKFKDKKYEKYEHLTRLEYTMRFDGEIGVNELSRIKDFEVRNTYNIAVLDEGKLDKLDPTVKAYVLCYLNGLMQMKEFSRRYKEKTKTALQEMTQINLDYILEKQFKEKILSTINKYIRK